MPADQSVIIDWGDSQPDSETWPAGATPLTRAKGTVEYSHTYETLGDYDLTVTDTSGRAGGTTVTATPAASMPVNWYQLPAAVQPGSGSVTVRVHGQFPAGSSIVCNDTVLTTTAVDANTLEAEAPAEHTSYSPASLALVIQTPDGARSTPGWVYVMPRDPALTITSVVPDTLVWSGAMDELVTVNGTGFKPDAQSYVFLGGRGITTYVSPTQMQVQVRGSDFPGPGDLELVVLDNTGEGAVSNVVPFSLT